MKLWVIKTKQHLGYDTYDSAVIAAETEQEARFTSPYGDTWDGTHWVTVVNGQTYRHSSLDSGWCHPDQVSVDYLGETSRDICGPIVSSFNAG
jgi:hypothetical protein